MREIYSAFALVRALLFSSGLIVACQVGAQVTVTIGAGSNTGTTANGAATDAGPMYCTGSTSSFIYSKHHMVYTAAELATAGIPAGVLISKIAWNKANNAAYSSSSAAIFDIYLKNSASTGVPALPQSFAGVIAGATQVYASTTQAFPATIGWVEFDLPVPFLYTGGALELTTNWDISAGGSTASGATANFAWAKDPGTNILSHAAASQSADFSFLRTSRAQIRFTYTPASACTAPPNPGAAVSSMPTVCAGEPFNLSLSGASLGTGQTYQWQSSFTGVAPWADITGATSSFYNTSQSVTTYYRCAVTCSGNTQYSDSVLVTSPALVSGVYTINQAVATGGTNFQSFSDAVNFVKCGIGGPVVFNVVPGSGPYNEQVTIPQIGGASSTNTITFNGNLETLSFNSTSTGSRAGFLLNGADHVVIDSFIIDGSAGTYAWGIVLTGQADSNVVRNCTINIGNVSSSSTNYIGVVLNGSATGTAVSGNNGNGNLFEGNTINGGYYGFYVYGSSTGNNSDNKFVDNIIRDNYSYAVYAIYQSNLLVSRNEMTRPTRTNSTTTAGVFLTTNSTNALIEKNRVHNMFDAFAGSTSTCYGIYVGADATAGQENKVINNLIYNIGGNGAVYGIYNTSGDYMQAYHNTVAMDDAAATSGSAYGLYQTSLATGIDYKNNIVVVTRSGTGTKRCVYFVTTTSTITSDNNIYYMNAGSGSNNHLGQYGTTNYTIFADWQGANGGIYDQQGLDLDPQFVSPSTGDYTPDNPLSNNTGTPVNVTTDILDNPRSVATPDAGAYEFSFIVAGINMSAEALLTPDVSMTGCYTASETITIRIRNNGSATLNFATNPVTVNVNVTGAIVQLLSTTISSGTLSSNATMDVVLPATLNMSAPGIYTFNASTVVTGDTNPADDAMPPAERTKETLVGGVAASTPDSYCETQTVLPVLSVTGATGYSTLQWQQSTTSGSGFADIAGATTTPFTLPGAASQNTYYRLIAGCGAVTDTTDEILVTVNSPQVTGTTPATRCGPGTVTLSATGSAGTDLKWYDSPTANVPVGTGASFLTPVLTSTQTFYVTAATGGGGIQHVGAADPSIGATSVVGTYYMNFTVVAPATIQSVDCYFNTVGSPFVINIREAGSGTSVFTYSGTTTVNGTTTPQVIPINATLAPGDYQIGWTTDPGTYRNSTGGSYPYTLPGIISITGNTFNDPNYYYYFYNWAIITGCESAKVPVIATVSSAPELSIAQDSTVCNNAITELSVASSLASFDSYVWSPMTDLFTDAAATIAYTGGTATTLYAKTAVPGITKYYVSASNTSTSCSNIDSVALTILPATIGITAGMTDVCAGESTTLTIPDGEYGNGLQWLSSPDGITYNPISGATSTTYNTGVLSDTSYFKIEVRNAAGLVCLQSTITINVNSPAVLNTFPGTRCSPGTVTLGATGSAGTTLNWYDVPTLGSPLGSGTVFTTPSLNTTTTFYVSASAGGGSSVTGMPAALSTAISGAGTTNYGLVFDALSAFTLQSVTIYPIAASAGVAGTVTIDVIDASNTVVHTATVNVIGNPAASAVGQTVTLNFNIQPGTNYKLRPGSRGTGITGLLFEPSASAPGGNYGYPYVVPGVLSINTSTLTAAPANTARNDLYYYFYNWVISGGCESPRVPVVASIAAPELSVAQDTLVCNGALTAISVTSNPANFDSYIWSPAAGLFTDAAGTIPYAGTSATTVYAKLTTAGIYKYYINASNSSTTCANLDSVNVTVLPGSVAIDATRSQICNSGTTTLSLPAGIYGNGIQWFSSPDGVTYTIIPGETSESYTTPNLTATTYYKVEITNGAGLICLQPTITINVGIPQVLSSTGATRCGPGTLDLMASVGPTGSTANWYESPSGGLPVATGTTFTTPVLTSSKTYYVASGFGFTSTNTGRLAPQAGAGTTLSTYGLDFTITQATTLNSVDVISTTGTSITVSLYSSGGTTQLQTTGALTVPTNSTTTVNLGWSLAPGTYRLAANAMTGSFIRENSTVTWPIPLSTVGQINGFVSSITGTVTTTASYYWFYNWSISTGCESPRVAVTATVNAGSPFSVARDSVVCSGSVTALSVESTLTDYDTYTWSPTTGLFNDAAATIPYTGGSASTLYVKNTTGGLYKYYITATDATTQCTGLDSVTLTVLPASLVIDATRQQLCGSGTTTLSLPAGEYGSDIQWYSSPDGVAYSPIAGATSTTYSTPNLTSTTYYKVEISNGAGMVCLQPTITIDVGVPSILSTTSGTRCDPGTVVISATPSPAGAQVNWYSSATGGLPIATGPSFTTPFLSTTTTYYAASGFGFTSTNTGRLAPQAGAGTNLSTYGLDFTITQAITLNSVDVTSTTGTSITVSLYSSGGTTQLQTTGALTVPTNTTTTVNLGWALAPGTYRLAANAMTGSFIRENSTVTWPIPLSTVGQINGFVSSITGSVTTSASYYWFYNWSISTGCESARTPVDAIINGSITIDAAPVDKTLCSGGQPVVFSVTASGAISSYQWRKDGVDIPGANSAIYTIPNATATDAGNYDVIVSGPCSTVTSEEATLTFSAPAAITTDPVAQSACAGSAVTFNSAATGDGSLGYQWRKDGVAIVGAYGPTLVIPNISGADAGNYDVIVTGGCNQDTSLAASLTLSEATAISTQPIAQAICTGQDVTLSVVASGAGTLSYQWRKGGINIAGATSASYTINGATSADAGNYDVVVTGACGDISSAIAGLTVNSTTVISTQPASNSACIGSNVMLSVVASGSGTLTYQWRKAGADITGATASSYTINGVTPADAAVYDVVITGSCGSVTSSGATITISSAGTWIGVQNSDWNNAANWCGTIPTSTTDVTIPDYAPNMPVLSNPGSARNITILNGATLTIGPAGTLNLYGNISGAGSFVPASGTLAFRGANAQTVPAFTAANVTMNGAGGFTLAGSTAITGTLTLTNGHITLGSNDLRLSSGSNGSATSHIVTNGTGRVVLAGMAASSTRVVPVGITVDSYTPVTITANAGHTTDDLFVRVIAHVLANGLTGNQLTEYVVDRTWLIDEMVPGGSNVNVSLQWNESDELTNFGRNESYVTQYTGGSWTTGTEAFASGSNPYSQTKTNVTTFAPFAVQTDPLPVVRGGIYPNPTRAMLNVIVRTDAPETLAISVFDETGRMVKSETRAVGFGGSLISLDVTNLSGGTYVLKIAISKDREFFVRRFVKVN